MLHIPCLVLNPSKPVQAADLDSFSMPAFHRPVDGTDKQGLGLLGAVLMHVAADIWLRLEGAHSGELLVDDIHALHGVCLNYHCIFTHLHTTVRV